MYSCKVAYVTNRDHKESTGAVSKQHKCGKPANCEAYEAVTPLDLMDQGYVQVSVRNTTMLCKKACEC